MGDSTSRTSETATETITTQPANRDLAEMLADPGRLTALRRTALLDSGAEEAFDRLTRLATNILGVPVALVTLIDADRQFFKSGQGLPEPVATARQTPLSHSFCQHVVGGGEALIVEDARAHPLVRDNLAIPDLGAIAYAGFPLVAEGGQVLGSFCAIDTAPRAWTAREVAILRDLAAAATTEIALREGRATLAEALALQRTILDSARQPLIAVDESGTIHLFNRAAEALFGYAAAEVVGRRTPRFLHDPDDLAAPSKDEADPALARWRADHQGDAPCTLVRKDGSRFPAQLIVSPWRADDGRTLGALAAVEDLTERRRAEDERRTFFDAAAHDLKNPLTIVRAYAQLARRLVERDPAAQGGPLPGWLATVEAQALRTTALIEELQDAARLDAGRPLALDRAETDLADLAAQIAATWQRSAEGHTITVRATEGELVGAWDRARLERVLNNLLSNAVKYSPDGGTIAVDARREDDASGAWAVLTIRDEGVGIPTDDLPRIFERYHRARNVGRIGGSGIGLAGSRQIAAQHGGTLTAASVEGRGSTFTLRLPLGGA